MTTVLLVNDERAERDRLGRWLEDAGYVVELCPGPVSPGYECIGGRSMRCPLAEPASVVVLDMHLGSDEAMRGTPAWHVLVTYIAMGKHVVVLTGPEDAVTPRTDDQVTVLHRPAGRGELLAAVQAAARPTTQRAEAIE